MIKQISERETVAVIGGGDIVIAVKNRHPDDLFSVTIVLAQLDVPVKPGDRLPPGTDERQGGPRIALNLSYEACLTLEQALQRAKKKLEENGLMLAC